MASQMKDLVPSPRLERPSETAEAEPAQMPGDRLQASAANPQEPTPEPQPVDQDLSALHRMKDGMSFFESGKYAQAREIFRSALAERPADSTARLYYAVSAFRANPADATSFAQVERNLRSVLGGDKENVLALETLALIEVEQRKWAAARENLDKLIALRPDVPRFLKTAGSCALMQGDVQAARDLFDRAAVQAPADAQAWSSLGDCESRLGNPREAEKSWKSSLSQLDLETAAGRREGLGLSVKLARSAYDRGAYDDTLAYARAGRALGASAVLRAYEGLSLAATGSEREGRAILEPIASSSDDAQAAALARSGLQEASP
jgi:predicted Zn-dependent protease